MLLYDFVWGLVHQACCAIHALPLLPLNMALSSCGHRYSLSVLHLCQSKRIALKHALGQILLHQRSQQQQQDDIV